MFLFIPVYLLLGSSICLILEALEKHFNFILVNTVVLLWLGIVLALLGILILFIFIRKRGCRNYLRSLTDTIQLRSFMKLRNNFNDFTGQKKQNLIQNSYNSALWDTYIDYGRNSMIAKICIPNSLEAENILDQNLKQVTKELKSYASDNYLISDAYREGHFYIFKGEKR